MNWSKASVQQLFQIVINENCPNTYKFPAVKELQVRRVKRDTRKAVSIANGSEGSH